MKSSYFFISILENTLYGWNISFGIVAVIIGKINVNAFGCTFYKFFLILYNYWTRFSIDQQDFALYILNSFFYFLN